MARNPSSRLQVELEKRSRTFRNGPVSIEHRYYFSANPPQCVNINLERHLRYIKHQPFVGVDSFATIQEFRNRVDAERHWEIQNSYDPNYLIRPDKCVKQEDKYVMIFPKIIRDFNGCWVNEHAKGQVSDADMWKILKKIGKNTRYLSADAQSKRPHGNLRGGIGITAELEPLFLNLGAAKHAMIYYEDVKDLYGFLTVILPSLRDSSIKGHVQRWMTFLSDSCLQVTTDSTPIDQSDIHPPYHNHNHVRLIVNYPSSWDIHEELQFLENMHKLCTDKRKFNLLKSETFGDYLVNCYSQWNNCFTMGRNRSGLNEVYQFGIRKGNYVDKSTGILSVPTIIIFSYSCVKHYLERVQEYNIIHNSEDVTHPDHMDPYLTSSEILAELDKEFPHLIENIYRAYYKAVAKGYKHPDFSVEQILPRLL